MTDGRIAGQAGEPLVREDVGDVAHLLFHVDLRGAGGDDLFACAAGANRRSDVRLRQRAVERYGGDARALLPAMLERV